MEYNTSTGKRKNNRSYSTTPSANHAHKVDLGKNHSPVSKGTDKMTLLSPTTIGDGIHTYDKREAEVYKEIFKKYSPQLSYGQFVRASAPGKTMIKNLIRFDRDFDPRKETVSEFCSRTERYEMVLFFKNLKKFPFYQQLKNTKKRFFAADKNSSIVKTLLNAPQFKFLFLPKALLPFHTTKKKGTPIGL